MQQGKKKDQLVSREVTRVITPGTLLDSYLLNPRENNYLMGVVPSKSDRSVGLAWLDLSTGEFYVSTSTAATLETDITRVEPRELLFDPTNENLVQDLERGGKFNITLLSDKVMSTAGDVESVLQQQGQGTEPLAELSPLELSAANSVMKVAF